MKKINKKKRISFLKTIVPTLRVSGTKKAPKLNFLGKFCRQKSLLKFWPMGGQKKV